MIAVFHALASYRATVLPRVERQLAGWEERAGAIAEDGLRAAALRGLEKRANVEATAVVATLAPRRHRPAVVAASTALQVAVDYLDVLSEEEKGEDGLARSLRLHRALVAALNPDGDGAGWKPGPRGDGQGDGECSPGDDGYLDQLVSTCRAAVSALPGAPAVLPIARREAVRCGEGQSHTHAAALAGPAELEAWAAGLGAPAELRWWEAAAGASSSVAAHALIALAATPGAGPDEAELVAAAYDPWVGALTVLLDDLVDREADRRAGEHSYLGYYDGPAEAAARLDLIAARAASALRQLPDARGHEAILTGVLAFYLGPRRDDPLTAGVSAAREPAVRLLAALLRFA